MEDYIIPSSEVVKLYGRKKNELSYFNTETIAVDCQQYLEIQLGRDSFTNSPIIFVTFESEIIDEIVIEDNNEFEYEVDRIYKEYLSHKHLKSDLDGFSYEDDFSDEFPIEEMEIDESEMEIEDSVYALLNTLVPSLLNGNCGISDIVSDLAENICIYLSQKYGLKVYRPMFLEDKNGKKIFCEYPYDEMEYE